MKLLSSIVNLFLVLFVGIMMIFRFLDGSFESAGERMDRLMGMTGWELGDTGDRAAGEVSDDLAGGLDDEI